MNVEISGRNYEVTDRIRVLLNKKLAKLEKYFEDTIDVRCVLITEKYRNICEIFIVGRSFDAKATQEADTMEDAINSTVDHLKRQAEKSRKKVRERPRAKRKATDVSEWTLQVLEPANLRTEDAQPRVIQRRNIPIRPMSIEQAAMTLDDSKNEFIVFRDLDTDQVTVIYRRRDNNFGMIAPEF
jgi:putative sigma-54 modulation protein